MDDTRRGPKPKYSNVMVQKSIQIPHEILDWIDDLVAEGREVTFSDVVREALFYYMDIERMSWDVARGRAGLDDLAEVLAKKNARIYHEAKARARNGGGE